MARICLVTHFFPPHIGGIEKVAEEQASRLSKLGYRMSVLTSKTQEQDQYIRKGADVFCYPIMGFGERVGLPYPIPLVRASRVFEEVIGKCDLVHVHGHPYLSSLMASKIAKRHKKPLILTQHNTFIDYQSWLNTAEHMNDLMIGRRVLKNADRVITVSRKTMEYVLKLGADKSKTSVIYNGVDHNFFHPMNKEKSRDKLGLPKNKMLILTVRRLVYKNGLDALIECASLLARDHPNILFIVIGNGPDRLFISNLVKQLGVNQNVKLVGFVPDELLPIYYNASDGFVIPSSSGEGLPLVLLEAMACGLPVIATSVGGTPEIIKNGTNGFLVPPRDQKALAHAVLQLLSLERHGKALGLESRRTIETNFNWDKNLQQLIKVYDEFL